MADLKDIFEEVLAGFGQRGEAMRGEAETHQGISEEMLKSPLSPMWLPRVAWESYKNYINPILWSATIMHSPVGSPMTSELHEGQYVPLEEPRKITEEDKRAAEGLMMVRMAELAAFKGGAEALKAVAPYVKPHFYRFARKTFGKKVPVDKINMLWNKINTPGSQFTNEEQSLLTSLRQTAEKTKQWMGKYVGEAKRTGVTKLLGYKEPAITPKPIPYRPPYRPEMPPEPPLETGGIGARIKPKPPTMPPAMERRLIAGKPAGAIVKTPPTGEVPLIEQVYPKKPYDVMIGLAGGTPQTTIGGEVGLGGLPEVPPGEPPRPPTGAEIIGEPMPEPPNAVKMITDAIKATKPVRGKLEKAYTAERAKRIKEFEKVMATTKGQAGYFTALEKMKGELAPKPSLEEIGKRLSQESIDELYEIVKRNSYYTSFEKMDIAKALTDILEGKLPQPHHYPLLENVFGGEFTNALMESKGNIGGLRNIIQQAINLPKAVKASFDFSAPYRQGIYWMLRPSQLGKTAPAFRDMFKYAFSEKAYQGWYEEMKKDPLSARMRRDGLGITDPSGKFKLSAKEEAYMTDIPEIVSKMPILKYLPPGWIAKGMRMSERAYVGFLNKLRFDRAKGYYLDAIKHGWNPGDPADEKVFKSIVKYVNSTTGRGDIGRLGSIGAELNATFWSPRFIKARIDMFNPYYYYKLHPWVRKKLILGWAEAIATGSAILGGLALAGKKADVRVEIDPRSSDFGKVRIGRTRFDIWGGHQQYVRVLAQLIAGARKTTTGKIRELGKQKWPFETRVDVLKNFGRGKLAPIPQLAWELMEGQKFYGGPIEPLEKIRDVFIPMVLEDIREAYDEFGANALWGVGVPATFGVGVQTYEERKKGISPDIKEMVDRIP